MRACFRRLGGRGVIPAASLVLSLALTPAALSQGLPNFADDEELRAFLTEVDEYGEVEWAIGDAYIPPPPPPPPMPSPPPPSPGSAPAQTASSPAPQAFAESSADQIVVTGSRIENPSITNTQVQGVDEGGIVKVVGDYLVVLRRGRLFTVSTADGGLEHVDTVPAYPAGDAGEDEDWYEGEGGWYDEMIVSGDLVVVIGYSYAFEATEINRFRLAADGDLTHLDTHHLRSDDYYSSRNYASRLIGDQLVLYAPLTFDDYWGDDPLDSLPGLSRWSPGRDETDFIRIAGPRDIYIPAPLKERGARSLDTMHVVTRCDLSAAELDCRATVVLGPEGRTFFVSRNATYVWVTPGWYDEDDAPTYLYRLPLDGSAPSAVQADGAPLDQFSFSPNEAENRLDILVLPEGGGDWMIAPEFASGQPALLRLPMARFGDGTGQTQAADYQWLDIGEEADVDRNRFIGDWLLVGLEDWHEEAWRGAVLAVSVPGRQQVRFDQDGPVSRIEAIAGDALVVSQTEDTHFTTLDLGGEAPVIADRFVFADAREAESRSHAFFFRQDAADGDGLAALPLLSDAANAADMVFLERENGTLGRYGRLRSQLRAGVNDECLASCVDWYGNARPIFLGERIFALLGYELVEGAEGDKRIEETRRVDFTPLRIYRPVEN